MESLDGLATSSGLPIDLVEDLWRLFNVFDHDGSRALPAKELGTILRAVGHGVTEAEVRDMIGTVDSDGPRTGAIDFAEFLTIITRRPRDADQRQEFLEIFRAIDTNNNGVLDLQELQTMLREMGTHITDEEASEMLFEVDLDEDGHVTERDFVITLAGQ